MEKFKLLRERFNFFVPINEFEDRNFTQYEKEDLRSLLTRFGANSPLSNFDKKYLKHLLDKWKKSEEFTKLPKEVQKSFYDVDIQLYRSPSEEEVEGLRGILSGIVSHKLGIRSDLNNFRLPQKFRSLIKTFSPSNDGVIDTPKNKFILNSLKKAIETSKRHYGI
jgi:hypothetical protein